MIKKSTILTPREHQAYNFIQAYIMQYHYAPTIAEIAKALGVRSRSMVQRILERLEAARLIQRINGVKRNIKLLDTVESPYTLPLLGRIATGQPIAAMTMPRDLNLASYLCAQDRYLLQVVGDSMSGDHICEGDWIICEPCKQAPTGSIVVALVDQQETTLKRIYYHPNKALISLKPSNKEFPIQTYDKARVQIQALYIALVRLAHVGLRNE